MARPDGGLIGRLRGARDDASGPIWIAEIDAEHRADFDRLKRELRVIETAQDEGRRNAPATGDLEMNASQVRIVGRITAGLRALNAYLAHQLGLSAAAAQRRMPQALDVSHARAEIDGRIAEGLDERRSDLVVLREQELETLRDVNYFRRRHGLNRSAVYRESSLLFFAVLVGLFVVESFANAFLLRRISAEGWVGGVALAAVISLVNIGLGLIGGGVGWRLAGHRFPLQRAMGWGVSVLALVTAFFWNIYAAHFREVAELSVDGMIAGAAGPGLTGHAMDALAHIRQHGLFGLTTLFSWGLFALGLLVHLGSSREAWDDMADRYWDYRRYDRAYRIARQEFEDAMAEAKGAAGEAAREVMGELETRFAPQVQERDRLAAAAELAHRRLAEARDAEVEWLRQGGALLKAYRDENAQVRTEAPPAYFARYPEADDYRHGLGGEVLSSTADDAAASRQGAERAEIQLGAAAETAARIQGENAAALAALRAHVAEALAHLQDRIDGLKQGVDRQAGQNLSQRAPAPMAEGVDGA